VKVELRLIEFSAVKTIVSESQHSAIGVVNQNDFFSAK
jgi:hypothetical protein